MSTHRLLKSEYNSIINFWIPSIYVAFLLLLTQLADCQSVHNTTSHDGSAPNQAGLVDSPHMSACNVRLNKIIGNIYSLQHDDLPTTRLSLMKSRILINYGQHIAYPKEDGTFEVDGLPSDSYVVEVSHPKYVYDPIRVDITSKGKIRARMVNYIQPSLVNTVEYPLNFKPRRYHNYFVPRETWRIMDLIFNPMVIMMVVPLIIIWLLPRMMAPQGPPNPRDNVQLPEYNVPELSEVMANMFGGSRASHRSRS